jgi:hypothetical protein
MNIRKSGAVLVLAFLTVQALAQHSNEPVVAFVSGSTLNLATASGQVIQRIDLKHPVAGFAISPNRKKIVVVSPDTEHGGALILIDLKTGLKRRITHGHFAFRGLNKGETEVYDNPAFSPNGRTVAFAVHGNQPGDGNDAWENSGPLAVFSFDTGKVRVLKSTENIDGNGPCSESDPRWSPDGKRILFNCEDGAFLTDVEGKTLRDLKISTDNAGSSAVAWVGVHCILYVRTPMEQGNFDFEHESVRILELNSSKSFDASGLLRQFGSSKSGLDAASGEALIRRGEASLTIETSGKRWELPLGDGGNWPHAVSAQLLTGWDSRLVPDYCK